MSNDETKVIDTFSIMNEDIRESLKSICDDLTEIGYDPTKQIVAYLISGDPGYISSHKECRNRIQKYNREDILEILLVNFMN